MKIAWIGHSLIHPRQYLFTEYLATLPNVVVMEIYPRYWGRQRRLGGFDIVKASSLEEFTFCEDVLTFLEHFKPDIVYCQAEWWQTLAFQCRHWSKNLKAKFVLFCWENLNTPTLAGQISALKGADLVVCGNKEAQEILKKFTNKTVVLPQVGIRTDKFRPWNVPKINDILFVGRAVPEKGIEYVKRLEADGYNVIQAKGASYEEMPAVYNHAKVLVVPSLTTECWAEQWPACIPEALLCGTPVVAFDSGSIISNFESCPIADFMLVEEGDYEGLKNFLEIVIKSDMTLTFGTEWAVSNYGHEAVAEKLLKMFEALL